MVSMTESIINHVTVRDFYSFFLHPIADQSTNDQSISLMFDDDHHKKIGPVHYMHAVTT